MLVAHPPLLFWRGVELLRRELPQQLVKGVAAASRVVGAAATRRPAPGAARASPAQPPATAWNVPPPWKIASRAKAACSAVPSR